MVIYVLVKGDERIEVLEGREARRDQLIAAGYEWLNAPAEPASPVPPAADLPRRQPKVRAKG